MRTACLIAVLALVPAGCDPAGPKKYDVSGAVSYDGELVADGDITFTPENPSVGPEGGKVKDGRYAMKAPEGRCRVVIRAGRIVPGKKDATGGPFTDNYIPKKYNDESTLAAEVGPGKTTHDFNLPK